MGVSTVGKVVRWWRGMEVHSKRVRRTVKGVNRGVLVVEGAYKVCRTKVKVL